MGSKVMINNQNMVLFLVFDHCKELNFHRCVATCCASCRVFCDVSAGAPGCTCQGYASEHCVSERAKRPSSRCMRARLQSRMRGRVGCEVHAAEKTTSWMGRRWSAGVYCALRLQLVNSVGEDGVGCIRGDAALVACVARHGDVSVQAPHIAPRVFDHVPGRGMKTLGGKHWGDGCRGSGGGAAEAGAGRQLTTVGWQECSS